MAYLKCIVFSITLLLAIISLDETRADDGKTELISVARKTYKFHCEGSKSKIKCRVAHLGRDSSISSDGKPYEDIEDAQIHSSKLDHDNNRPPRPGQLRGLMESEDGEKDEEIDAASDDGAKEEDEKEEGAKEKDGKDKEANEKYGKEKDRKNKGKNRCKGKNKKNCKLEKGFEEPEVDIGRDAMLHDRVPCIGENWRKCRPGGGSKPRPYKPKPKPKPKPDPCKGKNRKNCRPGRKPAEVDQENSRKEEIEEEIEERKKEEEEREGIEEERKEDGGDDNDNDHSQTNTIHVDDGEKKISETKCKGKNNVNCYKGIKQSRKLFYVLGIDE